MTLGFALRALRRHILLILITVAVVTGAGVALGSYLPRTYTSHAQILLGLDISGSNIDPQTASLYLKDRAMTYAQLVTTDEVISPVATAFNINPDALREEVVASIVPETVVLDLSLAGSSPEQSVALTQAISDRFRVQVSVLNVQTGGPAILAAQVSSPQAPATPDQLHGRTLLVVSALVGLVIGIVLALLIEVVKAKRAATRHSPKPRGDSAGRDPFPATARVDANHVQHTANGRHLPEPWVSIGATNGSTLPADPRETAR